MPVVDSEMIPPSTINHIYVPLVFDEPVLNKGPPHCIEGAPGHAVELFDALFVPFVQVLDDVKQPTSFIIRREFAVVLLCVKIIPVLVRFSGRRRVQRIDPYTMLRKVRPEVLPIPIVRVLEEQDRVDDISSEQQRLVRGNRGRDPAEPRVADEDSGEEEGSVAVQLRSAGQRWAVNT
jgi:hypothetical protein